MSEEYSNGYARGYEAGQQSVLKLAEYSNGYARGYEAGQQSVLKLAEQPAQRKPLTDDEIESINVRLAGRRDLARLFARAIEASHGIKENT